MNDVPDPLPRDLSRLGSAPMPHAARERLMTELAESLPGAVFQLESDRQNNVRYNFVSGRAREVLGVEPQAILDDPLLPSKLVIAQDSAILFAAYRDSAREHRPVNADVRIRMPDGAQRWVRTFATCRKCGDSILWDGYWNDVTDEIEARARLAMSEARLRDLTDSLPGVVFQMVYGSDGSARVSHVSEGMAALTGIEREAAMTDLSVLIQHVLPEDRPEVIARTRQMASEAGSLHLEFRLRHVRSGAIRWILARSAGRKMADGSVVSNGFWQDITEIKTLETELRDARDEAQANAQQLRLVTDSLPGMVYQYHVAPNLTGTYTMVSDQGTEMFGRTREWITGTPNSLLYMVVKDDQPKLIAAFIEAVRTQGNVDFTYRSELANGRVGWLRTRARPIPQPDGGVAWSGFTMEVTAEVEAREALLVAERRLLEEAQAAERRVREITESLPGVVYRLEMVGRNPTRITDMTDGALAMYGYTREQIMADSSLMSNGVHQDDRVAMRDEMMSSARAGRQAQMNFRFTRPDGSYRWLRTYAAAQLIDNGVAWVGYTADVTAEREAQDRADEAMRQLTIARDAAQAAEARLRAIFDYNRIGLVMIDEQRNFSEANPSLRELLEISDEQEFARDFPAFSPSFQPDGRPSMEKAEEVISQAFERGYNRFDWMHQTRAGEARPCEVALTRIQLGGKTQLFATMTDLRERMRHEAELQAAWAEAQAASKAKTDFLANMSHEIRTPMNAIVGLTHLGLSSHEPDRLKDYLGKIDTAAKSLLQIINDILDFSKIEAGKLSLEVTPFDLYGVLDNLSDMLNLRASEKGLELLFAVEPGVNAQLVGDPLRLGQVLLNLTGNAVKFTDQGQIVVRVITAKKGRDFVRLRFEITDTGIGLSQAQIDKLFESFSQADTSTTRRYGGTGLGLAISQRLVDLMDGEISVNSAPGRGSTFAFTARFGLAPAAAKRSATPSALRGMRVLVVDDNHTAVSILQSYLESFGFEVSAAHDGPRAIDAVRSAGAQGFRLVLMDWQMPGMNGIEAARRIRELARPEPTVIIMVTAFGREEVERQALSAGLDGFLIKPVNPSVLLDTILNAFGSYALADVAASRSNSVDTEQLQGRRVLLVEDNEINQEVARELLQRAGIRVDLAENGQQAVACAAATDYDAVLMDVQMPVMDGLEATRRIRALESARAAVPIIAMTANAMAEDRVRCIEAGMNDHLGKPVDVSRLYALLAKWTQTSSPTPCGEGLGGAPLHHDHTFSEPRDLPSDLDSFGVSIPQGQGEAGERDFDFVAAIRQMADSRALWDKLARRFLAAPPAPQQISELLRNAERDSAKRNAHSLKGVSATLGLLALQRAADALEQRLGQDAAGVAAELAALEHADKTARRVIGEHLQNRAES